MTEENSKWLVIVNPKASIGKAGKDWPQIKQILTNEGIEFDFFITQHHRHAIELVHDNIISASLSAAPRLNSLF